MTFLNVGATRPRRPVTPVLTLTPPGPAADELHCVCEEPSSFRPGWSHVEVWRRGDLIGEGDIRGDCVSDVFLAGLAEYYLSDPALVIRHPGRASRTGT